MLKQHLAETQQLLILTAPPAVQMQESDTDEAHVTVRAQVSAVPRRFPPLYLSRRQLVTAFTVPLLWTALLAALRWAKVLVPPALGFNANWAYLDALRYVVLPWLICLWAGYYLRNRRIAALCGVLVGMSFYFVTLLEFIYIAYYDAHAYGNIGYHEGTNFRWGQVNPEELLHSVLVSLALSLGAAIISQLHRGRRKMYDTDSNR